MRAWEDGPGPRENRIGSEVLAAALAVHRGLGPGLLETVYNQVLAVELQRRGLRVARDVPMRIHYQDLVLEQGFFADLLVEGCVLVELKSVELLQKVHRKQLLTFLKLSGLRLGYLINFGAPQLREGLVRAVNGLPET
jgi:GxxExxY protein